MGNTTNIQKSSILLFLIFTLIACANQQPVTTPISPMVTEIGITQTPTTSITPTLPTQTSSVFLYQPVSPPPERLEYAMLIAKKIYPQLPYIEVVDLYGEYAGCVQTDDFQNLVTYTVRLPIETVNAAFIDYFQNENWAFTEPTYDVLGKLAQPVINYNVYRISLDDKPAFESLTISLHDNSSEINGNHIEVKVVTSHIETKEKFQYLPYFNYDIAQAICGGEWWMWIKLTQ